MPQTRTPPTITITKAAASGFESRPRGSSRIAVRGLSASICASTRRLKPIAALRALTMHTTIHATCIQENGCVAPGQQRTGERERQREHRVAEAHEGEIGRELVHAASTQRACASESTPDTRYSSTSVTSSGTRTAMSAARLPGSMLPNVVAETERRRAGQRRALEQRARRHRRSDAPRLGKLAEHVQVVNARQAVGAERHLDVHRVERLERRRPDADVSLLRGHDTSVTQASRSRVEIGRLRTARRGRQAPSRSRKPISARYVHRRAPRRLPRSAFQTPSSSSSDRATVRCPLAGTRPPPAIRRGARVDTSAAVCVESRRIALNSAGETEYGACGARLNRTSSSDAERADRRACTSQPARRRILAAIESEQLVEDPRRHPRVAKQGDCGKRVADVADQRRAARPRFAESPIARHRGSRLRLRDPVLCAEQPASAVPSRGNSAPAECGRRRYDSSRWVCALTSAGSTATRPRSHGLRWSRHARPRRRCARPRP